jgi:hypothetical protein
LQNGLNLFNRRDSATPKFAGVSFGVSWFQIFPSPFLLKDVPFVVDDYVPSPSDAREMEAKLRRLVRAQGNRSGRGRLRSDFTEAPTHPPRGLIIVTGEQLPSGQSTLARTLIQRFEPGDVNLARLSEL